MASQFSTGNLHDLSGLVAVVTGGGVGLGLMVAQTLETNGAKVYITGRRKAVLEEAAKQATSGRIIPFVADVTSRDEIQRAVDFITKDTGHIDLLVNNAGITSSDREENPRPKPDFKEATIAEIKEYYFNYRDPVVWQDVLNTNIAATFTTTMAFLELLDAGNKRRAKDLPRSQIITIGSTGGLTRALDNFMYAASKAGVHHLMKTIGSVLVPFDIRSNIVCPGWFPSDMTAAVQKTFAETNGVMPRELVPQQRMGNPEEFAGTILYLASKAGGYCNGASLIIDGGYLQNHAGF